MLSTALIMFNTEIFFSEELALGSCTEALCVLSLAKS